VETYDVVVIGAGPGGYVAAIRAAQNGLNVACIEKNPELGGTCLNVGCIPSKSLLQSSELYAHMRDHGADHGINADLKIDFSQMMGRKERVVSTFNQGIKGLFRKNKVTTIAGHAQFIDPHTLQVGDQHVSARHIIIATGSEPTPLPFLPFDEQKIISSTGALALSAVPESLIVVGAGVIGVELGSVYARLGAKVHFIEFMDRICPTLDTQISKEFQKILEKQGLTFDLSTKVTAGEVTDSGVELTVEKEGSAGSLTANIALIAVGRRPFVDGLALDKAQITLNAQKQIPVNPSFQTAQPHIFAIGDVIDGPMLAHKASDEGVAVADLIAGKTPHINYAAIPNVVYTYPEVASVGLTEQEAKEMGLPIKTGLFSLKANSRAGCMGETDGLVKLIAHEATHHLLGMHIIAPHAGELIHEGVMALQTRSTVHTMATASHAHPTLAEAIKEAAHAIFEKPIHI